MARDEEILRRFCVCRDADDLAGAARHWERMLELQADRVRGMVETWPGGWLSDDERDEAYADAMSRLWRRMRSNWRGDSMGEWVMSTVQLVDYICRDVRKRSMAAKRGGTVSLDHPGADEEGGTRDSAAGLMEPERKRRELAADDAAETEERMALIRRHLPAIGNAKHRRAIEQMLDGGSDAELADEYGVEVNTVHVWRSRGLSALAIIVARAGEDVS